MLDVQFIRENSELVKQKSAQKNVEVDIDQFLDLDSRYRNLLHEAEAINEQRNKLAANITQKPSQEDVDKGKQLKEKDSELSHQITNIGKQYSDILRKIPNMPSDDVPVGKSEDDNVEIKSWGEIRNVDFKPKTHWELGESRDLIDRDRAARISGSRSAYLKGGLVEMQFAIIHLVMRELSNKDLINKLITDNKLNLSDKPFTPILPPVMMRTEAYEATGRLKAEETTYKLADDDMWLTASAEHSLCSMYMNEIIGGEELPIRYLGYSTAFRREAGSYGKDTNGIIRMHQFDKLEMEVFSTPETSRDEHLLLIAIQEHLVQLLELPYKVILKCTADIGDPNARGVDINVWMPGQDRYVETHSADYMTDYQARDLKSRFKNGEGVVSLLHTNDATAFALGRILAAIMENYQTKEGNVTVPTILRDYMSGKEFI